MPDDLMKPLIERLNRTCTRALEAAAGHCLSRQHYEVTVEHVLLALLEDGGSDAVALVHHFDLDAGRLLSSLHDDLEDLRAGNAGKPVFAPALLSWIQTAWLEGSLRYGAREIRSGMLVAALVMRGEQWTPGRCVGMLRQLPLDALLRELPAICDHTDEAPAPSAADAPGQAGRAPADAGPLGEFCIDCTARARAGAIDPVFGRDREIRQMVDILARRRKNNPLCVGEPGVGKTAVVEGLALRIAEGDVPESLAGVRLLVLDLGLLQAGASMKGEFEKRLGGVIEAVKAAEVPTILFIDEAHTLIGAGGAAGSTDAANLLKPALARGELRTVAATTWSEYKKYFEKDAALARRFQVVALDEPDVPTTLTMLRGLREPYERAHGVLIRDDALRAAAEMGARYIAARHHPDKGIDLVDTGAARVKVALRSKPAALQDLERHLQEIDRKCRALEREEQVGGGATHAVELAELGAERERLDGERAALEERWRTELAAAQRYLELRDRLLAAREVPVAEPGTEAAEELAAADAEDADAQGAAGTDGDTADEETGAAAEAPPPSAEEVGTAREELLAAQGEEPLVAVEVTAEVVARVVADWTGIPVGNMVRDQAAALLAFEHSAGERIKGQDHAIAEIGTGLRAASAGLRDPNLPRGVFLFVGPSGVGKTETALAVADQVYGGERFMTTINMSEFQEKHSVSRLIGSPPGYVGYGEGGVLTEAVRKRPYSVVLLDEVEKADLEVMNLFYQVFDKGSLSDGEGRQIDFRNTVLFLTSNLATDLITEACAGDQQPDPDDLVERIRPVLSAHFKPALLARMTIVPFYTIDRAALAAIARLKLGKLVRRLDEQHGVRLEVADAAIDAVVERCRVVETGARTIDHIISGSLMPRLATLVLQRLSEDALPEAIAIGWQAETGFTIEAG